MAESEQQVRLHGHCASPFVYRVIWALKLKGVDYDYVEEDLRNKSPTLLEHNPVHKKVPVLLHGGKPVAESAVILEYIEETWPQQTSLLPRDPLQRAMARFWIQFGEQNSLTFFAFFLTSEEGREETAAQVLETLKILQDRALGDSKFFAGNSLGLVDLYFGWLVHWFEVMEELVGVRVLEPDTLPRLHRWTVRFRQETVIRDNPPDRMTLSAHLRKIRETHLCSKSKRGVRMGSSTGS